MARRGRGDIDTLPERAGGAKRAVDQLTNAFEDLSKTGAVNHKTFQALSGTLMTIPHPAAQVAGLSLQVGAAIFKAASAAESFVAVGLQNELASVAFEADRARESVSTFQREMFSGATKEQAAAKQAIDREKELTEWFIKKNEHSIASQKLIGRNSADSMAIIKDLEKQNAGALERINRLVREYKDKWEKGPKKVVTDVAKELSKISGNSGDAGFTPEAVDAVNARYAEQAAVVDTLGEAFGKAGLNLRVMAGMSVINAQGMEESIPIYQQVEASLTRIGQTALYSVGQVGAEAFDAYADALDKTVSLNELASASLDRTAQNIAAGQVRAIGRQAAVEGAFYGAKALASLAMYDYNAAATYGQASAAMFGVAALAGVASGALSVKPGGGPGRGRGRGADGGSFGPGGPTVNVTVIGNLDDESAQDLGRRIAKAMSQGDA